MKIVPDWKDAWKWLSVHAAVLTAVVGALQAQLPAFQGLLTAQQYGWLTAACGLLVVVGRLVNQP